jgi:putative tryptophan/tyrosine transport system substrate-binding protein
VHRRAFLGNLVGGLLAAPLASEGQAKEKLWRIAYLSMASPDIDRAWMVEFRRGLRELGYIEGEHIVIEQRHAGGRAATVPELAEGLVRLKPDVIVVWGDPAMHAIRQASRTIPIVMAVHPDPVGAGLAASLSHPGGQVTGLSDFHAGTVTKRLEFLKEVAPAAFRIAVLMNPSYPPAVRQLESIQADAPALGMSLVVIKAIGDHDVDGAFATIGKDRPGALLIIPDPTFTRRRRIAELALKSRLPSITTVRQWAEAGILMSYGTSFPHLWHRAATYVDKILKGAKPADLPIEQPTKFELVINLKTAKALGLTIPPSLMARADHVIE